MLLTARLPPARQPIKLADLASRLRATTPVEIRAPEDELLALLLARLAADRQLTLSIPVSNFLLTHLPRTAAALREAVARLDRATLGQRHPHYPPAAPTEDSGRSGDTNKTVTESSSL